MNMMNDPRLRTDSYAKIFLYNTHETVACVPRHTIRMKDRVRPDKLREAVEQALLRFPHMMLSVERTETGFRYRTNVRPAVVLPFDGVSARYTIGSADTNGYLFLVGYHEDTIYMEYQHSISDGRGFEEFIRCVLFQYLKNCGCPVENDGTVRAMDTRWTPEESADGYEQLADREFSPEGIWKKPEAVHAPAVQWEAAAGEVVSEITFPFSQLHACAKRIGVSPLSIIAPLIIISSVAVYQGEAFTAIETARLLQTACSSPVSPRFCSSTPSGRSAQVCRSSWASASRSSPPVLRRPRRITASCSARRR